MIQIQNDISEYPFFSAQVSGGFDIKVLEVYKNKDIDFLKLKIKGLTEKDFTFNIRVDEAGGNALAPDLGDVFRTLMKLLKQLVCPECL